MEGQGEKMLLLLVMACLVGGLYMTYGDKVMSKLRALLARIRPRSTR